MATLLETIQTALQLHKADRLDEAEPLYRQVLQALPDQPDALRLLGLLERRRGRLDSAVALLTRAAAAAPMMADTHYSLGNILLSTGRLREAIAAFQSALMLRPDHAEAHNNLGNALQAGGRLDLAAVAYGRALVCNPAYAEAYNNLGAAFQVQGQFGAAVAAYRNALALKPDYHGAHNNLGLMLLNAGLFDEAIASYRRALTVNPVYSEAHSNLLSALNYKPDADPDAIFAEYRSFDARHVRPQAARHARPHTNSPDPERRLRIGYVSPDFRRHSCAYFMAPLLAAHDRRAVEVFGYAEVKNPDGVTEMLRGMVDHWFRTPGVSDTDLAERVRADGIDILVDLTGHLFDTRVMMFTHKPAPIQVSWLGYPNTTGLSTMDYRLTDAIADPPGDADRWAAERLVRLPHGFHCYGAPPEAPPVVPPPSLAQGGVTFGSFNNTAKVNDRVIATWAEILKQVPDSRLMLKSQQLADGSIRQRYLDRLAAQGIGPERVDLNAWAQDAAGHLALYHRLDIALDPFPYNGTTTTCEAMWMGVPVVTLRGASHPGRVGASLLTRVGLSELVAADRDAYIALAVDLARSRDQLAELRAGLRGRMSGSPLGDPPGFARQIETAYRDMWRRWCMGR